MTPRPSPRPTSKASSTASTPGAAPSTGSATSSATARHSRRSAPQGRFDRLEGSWDEHTAYIKKAHEIIAPALANNLQALAQGVNVEGRRVVVYNPLPWKRSGVVSLDAAGFAPAALKPTDGGEACAC